MAYSYERAKWCLKAINEDLVKELTDWEEKFIDSVTKQFEKNGILTDKQFEIVERIYEEKT